MAEFAGQFIETLVSFGAAVSEKNFPRSNALHNGLGEAALWFVVIQIGNVDKLLRLLDKRLGDFAIGVPQRAHSDASSKIQESAPQDVPDVAAGAAHESQIEPPVTRHDILSKQFLNRFKLITNDRRRRWKELFHGLWDDFGADSGIGKNFQQHGMRHAAIYKKNFFNAGPNRSDCAVHLWDHAFVHDAFFLESIHFTGLKVGNQRCWVFGIPEEARDIAHKHQPSGIQPNRGMRRCDVRVAIVNLPILASRSWADHRSNTLGDAFQERRRIHGRNFAYVSKIHFATRGILKPHLSASKDLRSRETPGASPKTVDRVHNFRV